MKEWYYGKQCMQSKRVLTKNGAASLVGKKWYAVHEICI